MKTLKGIHTVHITTGKFTDTISFDADHERMYVVTDKWAEVSKGSQMWNEVIEKLNAQ